MNVYSNKDTIKWAVLGQSSGLRSFAKPKFASVWMIDEAFWETHLKTQGYKRRPDRLAHPGACCQDESKNGYHASIKFLFGSSKPINRSTRHLFKTPSPTKEKPQQCTFFGAYWPSDLPTMRWDKYREEKKIRQTHTSDNIKIDAVQFRTYLQEVFTID